jgi:hypothetical protein
MVGDEQPREDDKSQSVAVNAEESDAGIVPKKLTKTRVTPVESVEGRAAAKGKSAARNRSTLWYAKHIAERRLRAMNCLSA